MKKFFYNILLFGLAFLMVNVLAYFALAKQTIMKDYILPHKTLSKYHSFMVADSHGKAIRQSDLTSTGICNFSYDSDSYFDMLVKVDYLVKNYQIDTLYLTVDDHTLSQYREWWTNRRRSIYYANYPQYKEFYHSSLSEFLFKKYVEFYTPLFSTGNAKVFRRYLEAKLTGKELPNYDNFDISVEKPEQRRKRSRDRIKIQYPSDKTSDFLRKCLTEIVTVCQQNDIEIIGIKYPLTREFIQELGDKSFHADLFLKEKGYRVIDMKASLADHTSYFRDQDHLNYTGSEQFITLIKEDL